MDINVEYVCAVTAFNALFKPTFVTLIITCTCVCRYSVSFGIFDAESINTTQPSPATVTIAITFSAAGCTTCNK